MTTVASGFEIRACLQALAAIEADLCRLTEALSESQFHAPPRAGGWSIGFCIEHLVLTGQAFLQKWDLALAEAILDGRRAGQSASYPWWLRQLLKFAEPPYRTRTKTTYAFVPCSRYPMDQSIRRFLAMHREFISRVERTRGLDVKRTKVQSPFVTCIWYPLGFSFDLALAHERRHLWQAWQVRKASAEDGERRTKTEQLRRPVQLPTL